MANHNDWETMPLRNPQHIGSGREDDLKVFIAPREGYHLDNECLARAALIMASPNQYDRQLAHRLRTRFATIFHEDPKNFEISQLHPNFANMTAIYSP